MPSDDPSDAADTRLAATGMVPEAAETILTKGLIGPPDLGGEPRRGASPAAQVAAAGLLARIDGLAPGVLDSIEPRIRARAETINKYIRSGMPPEQAAQRADELVAAGVTTLDPELDPGFVPEDENEDFEGEADGVNGPTDDEDVSSFTRDGVPGVSIRLPEPTEHPDGTKRIPDAEVTNRATELLDTLDESDTEKSRALDDAIAALSPRDWERVTNQILKMIPNPELLDTMVEHMRIPPELIPTDPKAERQAFELLKRI